MGTTCHIYGKNKTTNSGLWKARAGTHILFPLLQFFVANRQAVRILFSSFLQLYLPIYLFILLLLFLIYVIVKHELCWFNAKTIKRIHVRMHVTWLLYALINQVGPGGYCPKIRLGHETRVWKSLTLTVPGQNNYVIFSTLSDPKFHTLFQTRSLHHFVCVNLNWEGLQYNSR